MHMLIIISTETIDEARALDFKILNAWIGHPVIRIIDNSTDFGGKIKRVVTQVTSFLFNLSLPFGFGIYFWFCSL